MASTTDIDSDWFYRRIAAQEMSLREVARTIDMDPTALSRTLRGQRRLQMGEVETLAHTLDVSVEDVLRHAGLPSVGGLPEAGPQNAPPTPQSVPMISHLVDADGRVTPFTDGRALPPTLGNDVSALMIARGLTTARMLLVTARTGPLALLDQGLILVPGSSADTAPVEEGSLCLFVEKTGESLVRMDRSLKYGDASLIFMDGTTALRPLDTLLPIIAVLP